MNEITDTLFDIDKLKELKTVLAFVFCFVDEDEYFLTRDIEMDYELLKELINMRIEYLDRKHVFSCTCPQCVQAFDHSEENF